MEEKVLREQLEYKLCRNLMPLLFQEVRDIWSMMKFRTVKGICKVIIGMLVYLWVSQVVMDIFMVGGKYDGVFAPN